MNTKNVPAIVMLAAGFVNCVISIYSHMDLLSFTKRLLFVLVIFYILGIGVKIILDKNFPIMSEEDNENLEEDVAEDEDVLENIDTDGEEGVEDSEFSESDSEE